jgi:hypothetical protein
MAGEREQPQRYEAIHVIPRQTTREGLRPDGRPTVSTRTEWDPPKHHNTNELDKLRYSAGLAAADINCRIDISIHNGHYVLHFFREVNAQGVGGESIYDGGFDFDQATAFLDGMRELVRMIRMQWLPTIGQIPDRIPAPIRRWLDQSTNG